MPTNQSSLGQLVVYNDYSGSLSHLTGGGPHHGGGGGGGGIAPQPTLIPNSTGGLQFNLIWDTSVASAPSGFQSDVIATATYLESLYSTHATINIHVGWGEIAGQALSSGALGESETNGYLENYSQLASQLGSSLHLASNEPTNAQFFISSAQAKAFGLNVSATAIDGYIGFGTLSHSGYSWNMNYSTPLSGEGTPTGTTQYDLQSVVQHEITEVMGRIGMEGETFNHKATYTALDLFDYKAPDVLELSSDGGYYSADNGVTHLGTFNDASLYSGDVADWASYSSISQSATIGLATGDQDSFDAFGWSGVTGDLSQSDVQLMSSLGFSLDLIA